MDNFSIKKASNYDLCLINDYKNYILSSGANKEILDFPAVKNIISNIVVDGDPVLKANGKNPLYFKDANEDGTFDICGKMCGLTVSVVYKMEYCNDDNPKHFISLKCFLTNYKYDINYYKLFINDKGMVVDWTKPYNLNCYNIENDGLLGTLKKGKILKKFI